MFSLRIRLSHLTAWFWPIKSQFHDKNNSYFFLKSRSPEGAILLSCSHYSVCVKSAPIGLKSEWAHSTTVPFFYYFFQRFFCNYFPASALKNHLRDIFLNYFQKTWQSRSFRQFYRVFHFYEDWENFEEETIWYQGTHFSALSLS